MKRESELEFLESKTEWYQNLKKFGEDVMRFPNGSVYAYDTVNVNRLFIRLLLLKRLQQHTNVWKAVNILEK